MISVRPRYVAPEWERVSRPVMVGREADVQPDQGALDLYLSVFPDRFVRWSAERQLFEIRVADDIGESRIEFVFFYDAPPNPITGDTFTEEQLAWMIESRNPLLEKCYRHFDHEFVKERLRQRQEYLELGAKKYNQRIADLNRQAWVGRLRGVISEAAARIGENKHYMKYIGSDGALDPRQRYRPEYVPVGVELGQQQEAT